MTYKTLTCRITGAVPLVMHNGQLADPLNPHAQAMKRVSGKRNKTDADHEELARLEFRGGLYLHDGAPCIPGEVLEAALIEGARKNKRGIQAKAGIICDGNFPLLYDGPKDPDDLWADERYRLRAGVKIGRARIMRTRPLFPDWAAEVRIEFLPDLLNESEVREFLVSVGRIVGLGDWRPKFGRFAVAERA